jgi:hypothetical protein
LNLSPTVDLLELFIVVVGTIGLAVSIIMLAIIQGDRRNVRISKINGINKRMTNADLRNELSRTYKLVCFLVLGLLFMAIPPPANPSSALIGQIVRYMVISWEIIAAANSLWAYVDRQRNVEYLRERLYTDEQRYAIRDPARDLERDPIRDLARDKQHDAEADMEGGAA